MKKVLGLFLLVLPLLLLASCGKTYVVSFDSDGGSTVESQEIAGGSQATEPTDPTKEGAFFSYWYLDDETVPYDFSTEVTSEITLHASWEIDMEAAIKNMNSLEVQDALGNGTNLGNTMESWGRQEEYLGTDADPTAYETFWGQPVTTAEMIQGMKDSGFDSIRIPVAWTNTMNYEDGDYTIADSYLNRVGEIINYAIDAEMFVIINDHWDGGWWGMFGSNTESVRDDAMDLYTSMWSQIAEYYQDYSYRLIFESANEELGDRLNDRDVAEDSGYLQTDDQKYEATNMINQAFVDTIRESGGKNADRFLLIAGFNTDITLTVDERFEMPTDTADSKLLVSVHYYTPWNYCGSGGDQIWGSEIEYNAQNDFLEMMTVFTEEGYGVIIGEYGVLLKSDGTLKQRTLEFTTNFINNCNIYGYASFLWDTNAFFRKDTLDFIDADLLAFYQSMNNESLADTSYEDLVDAAEVEMAAAIELAKQRDEENGNVVVGGQSYAWIMFSDAAWSNSYSVGDTYNPADKGIGIVAVDQEVNGEGTFVVSLDFTGTEQGYANGVVFCAVGVSYGEINFEGYIIDVKEILINGEVYEFFPAKIPYTASDDGITTRANLYNQWVSALPEDARTLNPNLLQFATPEVLDALNLAEIYTLQVTFNYVNPNPDTPEE